MRINLRAAWPGIVAAACGIVISGAAHADWVPPFKGNDTGGIVAWSLVSQVNVRQLATEHCASYGKVAVFLAAQRYYGGYVSFACRWVPPRYAYRQHVVRALARMN